MHKSITAGILMYYKFKDNLKVFLVHPGGPFWKKKDNWGIPKGHKDNNEKIKDTAIREFEEETGIKVDKPIKFLGAFSSKNKNLFVWIMEKEWNGIIKSNEFELEWPAGSGIIKKYPEIDAGNWFNLNDAEKIIFNNQKDIIKKFKKTIK